MTQTCISTGTVTSGPDQRVNYAHGMVLGVDDVVTEQNYWLYHRYLAQRGLAGLGTVYGLQVTAGRPAGAESDVEVTVSPGLLVDQFGRDAVIRCPQCARLGQWLAARELAEPGTVASRLSDGRLTVYVVARYEQVLDTLVPLPGSPCSSSDELMTPSRIRDCWEVDLTFDRPPMPRWDTDRRLARLLARVDAVAGLPEGDSEEPDLLVALLGLLDSAGDGPDDLWPSGASRFRIPAEAAPDVLDRLFVQWVTRVRPALLPDLTTPPGVVTPSEPTPVPEILLSTLTFTPANPFDVASPQVEEFEAPDDTGRPYLLHGQLVQLLGSRAHPLVRPLEFAHLSPEVDAGGTLTGVSAWFTSGEDVRLPDSLTVTLSDGTSASYWAAPVGAGPFDERWRLSVPPDAAGLTVADGELLRVTFPGDDTLVGRDDDHRTLAEAVEAGLVLVDARLDGDVDAYATAWIDDAAAGQPQEFAQLFATVTADGRLTAIRAWFTAEGASPVALPDRVAVHLDDGTRREYRAAPEGGGRFGDRWRLVPVTPTTHLTVRDGQMLRVRFPGGETVVQSDGGDRRLAEVVASGSPVLLNATAEGDVDAYAVALIDDVGAAPAAQQATVEFATLTPSVQDRKLPVIEVWFHPQPRGAVEDVLLVRDQDVGIKIFEEPTGAPLNIVEVQRHPTYPNVWTIVGERTELSEPPWPAYLRLLFPVDDIKVEVRGQETTLGQWIDEAGILFLGWDPAERLVTCFSRHTIERG